MSEIFRITDLTVDTGALSVLSDFCVQDGQIDTAILDNNTDGYLDYKRSFLSELSKEQYLLLQKDLQRFGFKVRDEENVQEAFEAYDKLKQNGLDAGAIYSDLEKHASWFLESYSWELPDLLKSFGSPQNLIHFLQTLATTPPWTDQGYWGTRFAFTFVKKSGTVLNESDWSEYLRVVAIILPYTGGERRKRACRAIENLTLDWRACTTLVNFGKELARALNSKAADSDPDEKWPEILSNTSALLCDIYEHEKDKDSRTSFLSGFGAALSDQAFYQLISLNYGGHLMTMVFDILWRPRRVDSISHWLNEMDPDHNLTGKFLASASSLDRIKIFAGEIDFTIATLFEEFWKRSSGVSEFAIILTHYLDELLSTSSAGNRQNFADLLWSHYQKSKIENTQIHKAMSFWIQYYSPKYRLEQYRPELKSVRQELPAIRTSQIPLDTWLKDKTLQARLCFYGDEEYTTRADDKSDGQNWFEYTQDLLKVEGWRIVSTDLSSPMKICVMQKQVNGISLKMTLTLQGEGTTPGPLPGQENFEIIAHRGHYNTLTFSTRNDEAYADFPQLLYLGACKSMSFASSDDFQDRHSDDFIVSDSDVSRGETSTAFLNQFMTDVANGRTEWEQYRKYCDVYKFVLPDSPMMLVSSYMRSE